jgi:hypothetical protein
MAANYGPGGKKRAQREKWATLRWSTLSIGAKGEAVMRGIAEAQSIENSTPHESEAHINAAVEKLFREYPPKSCRIRRAPRRANMTETRRA